MLYNKGQQRVRERGKVMDSIEKRLETLEYYQTLFFQMIDKNAGPFFHLVIKNGLTKEEIEGIHAICQELQNQYEDQKAQGLVIYTDLLTQFAGQLHPKLNVDETVQALLKQSLYRELMEEFSKIIHA